MSDTQLSALQQVVPEITAAVNGFRSESVQRDAFRVPVDLAAFDLCRIDWNESAMSTALLAGLLGHAGYREVIDKLAAIESASLSPSPCLTDRPGALTADELRTMARRAGRGEHVSLA